MSARPVSASPPGPVLIVGALSDIGAAVASAWAERGRPLILAARESARLAPMASDLALRYGAAVRTVECDVLAIDPAAFLDSLGETPAVLVCVVGLLGDQGEAERDPGAFRLVVESNFTAPAALIGEAANRMAGRGAGVIVGVSSVAGERGRASNYAYGAAKAGLTAFLSGLRNRLAGAGVRVITVLPGFVDTRMTAGMKLPAALTARPEEVAKAILAAEARGRDVIWVRPVWRWIMLVIRLIPESIFKRLKL